MKESNTQALQNAKLLESLDILDSTYSEATALCDITAMLGISTKEYAISNNVMYFLSQSLENLAKQIQQVRQTQQAEYLRNKQEEQSTRSAIEAL